MRVALFGGSFNPPHVAHVLAVTYALSAGGFQRVLVVPVFVHAFDKNLAKFEDRLEMCRLSMGWIPGVDVSDVERELGAPSRTVKTIERIEADHPDYALRLMIGSDVCGETGKWHAFDAIRQKAPPYVLGRVGHPDPAAPPPVLPEISSTWVRSRLTGANRRVDDESLRRWVPTSVLEYIDDRALYR